MPFVLLMPPVVSSTKASWLRSDLCVPSGEWKVMPIIILQSAAASATHMNNQRLKDPPLPWPEPNSGPLSALE